MAKKMAKKGKRMAFGGPVGYGGNKTNDPVGRGGMGGTGLGGVSGGMNAGGGGRGGPAGGVTTGTMTGTSERNRRGTSQAPEFKTNRSKPKMNRSKPKINRPAKPAIQTTLEGYTPPEVTDDMLPGYSGREPLTYETMGPMFKRPETGTNWPGQGRGRQTVKRMAMGGPAMSDGLPPAKMPGAPRAALTQSAVQPPVDPKMLRAMAPGKMAPNNMGPMSGGIPSAKMPGAPRAALTQSGAQQGMMQNMGPNNMAPMKMRNGGMARKGNGLTMAKGGLVKGCGCVSKGVKKPRIM